jgi:hypothetical protein
LDCGASFLDQDLKVAFIILMKFLNHESSSVFNSC